MRSWNRAGMSWQATSWAARQTAGNSGRKALLLLIANAANVEGVCWVGRAELAKECECQPGTVSANLVALEDADLISRHRRTRRNGSRTTDWIVLGPQSPDRGEMKDARSEEYPQEITEAAKRGPERQGQEIEPTNIQRQESGEGNVRFSGPYVRFSGGPEPVIEQTTEQTGGPRELVVAGDDLSRPTNVHRIVRHNGKPVAPSVVVIAERLLTAFNEATSRDLGACKTNGSPSPALTQILSAVLARPNVSLDRWMDAVRFTAANPPEWVKGPLQVGHVFGERAADWALAAQNGRAGDSPSVARGDAIIAEMLAEQRRTQ